MFRVSIPTALTNGGAILRRTHHLQATKGAKMAQHKDERHGGAKK